MPVRFETAVVCLSLWLCAITPATALAQSAENVAVVINDSSAASKLIGDYYVQKRRIPAANVFHIKAVPEESVSRAVYTASIERPLAAAIARNNLQDRLLYIVLTKGVPLRIEGSVGAEGTVASVDSELALLYRRMVGLPAPIPGRVRNPYFLGATDLREARHFTHRDHDIYLVSRLDAFTVDEALGLIDGALAPKTDGEFVFDERAALVNPQGDRWLEAAADRVRTVRPDARVTLEKTAQAATAASAVLGYASWGSTDPQLQRRSTGQTLVKGSLAMTLAGADARTFQAPPPDWSPMKNPREVATWFGGSPQSLVGDLIRDGATGAAGSVAEPFLEGVPRPDIVFPAYLAGFNLVESFYLATPFLSWQTVVIGDPLCGPFVTMPVPPAQLEVALDKSTELPALFSARRLAVVRAGMPTDQDAAPTMLRAETRLARGDNAGARTALLEAVKAAPARPGPQLQLAMMDEAAGDHASAVSRYRRVIELQPDNAIALNNLAFNLAVHGNDAAGARPLAARAVNASRRNPSMVDTLAWVDHLLGNDTSAAALLQEAVKGAPTNADIRLHAAQVAAARGLKSEAGAQLRQALRLNPALADRRDVTDLQASLKEAAGP